MDKREKYTQELFGFYTKLSETFEHAGALWTKVDGQSLNAQRCFNSAAVELEKAAALLEIATEERETDLQLIRGNDE